VSFKFNTNLFRFCDAVAAGVVSAVVVLAAVAAAVVSTAAAVVSMAAAEDQCQPLVGSLLWLGGRR
jgi:hypothetical protein